ncbi:MAG: SdiA-regulated domain-containing protein, partial [Pseudomonadota bacterium]
MIRGHRFPHLTRATPIRHAAISILRSLLCCGTVLCGTYASGDELDLISAAKVRDVSAGFSEPSGLAFSRQTGHLWAVSDAEPLLHRLDDNGALVDTIDLSDVPGADFEGVAIGADGAILVIQEGDRAIVVADPDDATAVRRVRLDSLSGFSDIAPLLADNPPNKGLEGITVDPLSGTIFVVVEGRPRLLISISPDLSTILDATLLSPEFGFTSPHADDEDLDV